MCQQFHPGTHVGNLEHPFRRRRGLLDHSQSVFYFVPQENKISQSRFLSFVLFPVLRAGRTRKTAAEKIVKIAGAFLLISWIFPHNNLFSKCFFAPVPCSSFRWENFDLMSTLVKVICLPAAWCIFPVLSKATFSCEVITKRVPLKSDVQTVHCTTKRQIS